MEAVLLIVRLLLALVFAVAGLAKLADRPGARQAIADFGVPSALARPLGILLPLAELAVAVALIPTSTALWGSVGALALLLLFVLGIGVNLARGNKPECHCFGQLSSSPAGWETLVRNGVLAALAGFLTWRAWEGDVGPSATGWLATLSGPELAALLAGLVVLAAIGAQWWFLVHLLRQNGRLMVRLEALEGVLNAGGVVPSPNGTLDVYGLPIGSEAPDFGLSGLYGETLTLESLLAPGKPVVLLFTDPNCGPCTALLPEIRRWQKEHAESLTFALVSRGPVAENRAKATEHGLTNVLLQKDWEVMEAYEAPGTPSALIVGPDGTIASTVLSGADTIRNFVSQLGGAPAGGTDAAPTQPAGPKVGEPAPEVKLPDLKGNTVELADYRGQETLVAFWNPGCGFCQQMLPDLKEWEANPPEGAPKLLVVSTGSKEANEAMGLSAPVLLDQGFATGRAFGAIGTPAAVVVDAEGKIASEVVAGAPKVLELAGASPAGS